MHYLGRVKDRTLLQYLFEKLIATPIYDASRAFSEPSSFTFEAIYLEKEAYSVNNFRVENVIIDDSYRFQ